MCQRLGERANIRGSFTVSPFTGTPFACWFWRTRPLVARIMLPSLISRPDEPAGRKLRTIAKGLTKVLVPDSRCDSTTRSRGLTLDDCTRYDYAARATLCHPVVLPPGRPRQASLSSRPFASFRSCGFSCRSRDDGTGLPYGYTLQILPLRHLRSLLAKIGNQ